MRIYPILMIALLTTGLFVGCTGEQDTEVRKEEAVAPEDGRIRARDLRQHSNEPSASHDWVYTEERSQVYYKKSAALLDDYRQRIERLSKRAKNHMDALSPKAQDKIQQAIGDLKQKETIAAQRIHALKTTSRQAWDQGQPGVEAAMADLIQSYEQAQTRLKHSLN